MGGKVCDEAINCEIGTEVEWTATERCAYIAASAGLLRYVSVAAACLEFKLVEYFADLFNSPIKELALCTISALYELSEACRNTGRLELLLVKFEDLLN
jgi:hypothetical protein